MDGYGDQVVLEEEPLPHEYPPIKVSPLDKSNTLAAMVDSEALMVLEAAEAVEHLLAPTQTQA